MPPLPDETLVSVPLRFVSEARTEPIAFAITNLCVYVNIINPSPHEWGKGGPVYELALSNIFRAVLSICCTVPTEKEHNSSIISGVNLL